MYAISTLLFVAREASRVRNLLYFSSIVKRFPELPQKFLRCANLRSHGQHNYVDWMWGRSASCTMESHNFLMWLFFFRWTFVLMLWSFIMVYWSSVVMWYGFVITWWGSVITLCEVVVMWWGFIVYEWKDFLSLEMLDPGKSQYFFLRHAILSTAI